MRATRRKRGRGGGRAACLPAVIAVLSGSAVLSVAALLSSAALLPGCAAGPGSRPGPPAAIEAARRTTGTEGEARTEPALDLEGFEQILPRGAIPAVDDPVFVRADQADIPDDAWVVGVFDGRTAKAYALTLLNEHEIVNDVLGDAPIATTW